MHLVELPIEPFVLDNGCELRLVSLPHLQTATVAFFVRVGSRYEEPQSNGLSHFLEHMLFRGTSTHPAAHELNLAIEQLGGTLDAATHVDFTSYHLTLPPESIACGIELLSDVLCKPLLTDLHTEKQIIREEILDELDEEGEQVDIDNISRRLLYPDHPLGFSIVGPLENLDQFTTDDLRQHHTRHYLAQNATVCVAGAFDGKQIKDILCSCVQRMQTGNVTNPRAVCHTHVHRRFEYVFEQGSQTTVRLSFHTPGTASSEAAALLMLSRVLDDGLSTRIHRTICEERGLAYDAFAGTDMLNDCGVFDFGAAVAHHKAPTLVESFLELIDEIRQHPPTEREVEKAKLRYLWELRTARDDSEGTAHYVCHQALFGEPEQMVVAATQARAVTPKDIQQVAIRYLDPDHAYLSCIGALNERTLAKLQHACGV